jgi:Ca-activated chloride channel family protein
MKYLARWMATCVALVVAAPMGASANQVALDVAMGSPYVVAGDKSVAYVRMTMTGFELADAEKHTQVNLAIVLDKSGSMQGEKIDRAKAAARRAIARLAPDDIVSIITYDSTVHVLVPATKVSDKQAVYKAISRISANGQTALFGGISKGAHEVRKFFDEERVNRIILLSDGLANVGPSSPGELGELGRSLGSEGIPVTTIGLGLDYNEDLMTQLAMKSDGNHMFAENAKDIEAAFLQELGDVISVIAKDVEIELDCADGVRPIRILGREGEIIGTKVRLSLNQLYSSQQKYAIVEVEVPATEEGAERAIGSVGISYRNLGTGVTDRLNSSVAVIAKETQAAVDAAVNKEIMASVVYMIGVENNKLALDLRDKGQVEEAKLVLHSNVLFLRDNGRVLDSSELEQYAVSNDEDVSNLDDVNWKRQRKIMRKEQYKIQTQQGRGSGGGGRSAPRGRGRR